VVEWKNEKLYLVREVAALLGVSRQSVHAWLRSGKMGGRLLGSGMRAVSEADIDAFVAGAPASPNRPRTDARRARQQAAAAERVARILGGKP
jgi:excisionase family DNA binding protein